MKSIGSKTKCKNKTKYYSFVFLLSVTQQKLAQSKGFL